MEKRDFPKDPIERCHLRWSNLFWGVWRCLLNKDPIVLRGLILAFEREGLYLFGTGDGDFFYKPVQVLQEGELQDYFALNPSDEVLERTARFSARGSIPPKLGRGKRKQGISYLKVLEQYSFLFFLLKDLPKKTRSADHKKLMLKTRYEKFSKPYKHYQFPAISDKKLNELCESSETPKSLAKKLLANLYKITPASIDKLLDKARKKFPHLAQAWKNGAQLIESE